MIVTILGSGSGLPTPNKNHSCLLVQSNQKNLLVDCGEPAARTLTEYDFKPDFLDGIVISHLHPDHISGIYMLIQLLHISKRQKDLYLFLPERENDFIKSMEMLYLFPAKLPFNLIIQNITTLNNWAEFVQIFENDHLKRYRKFVQDNNLPNKLKSYSILLKGEDKNLFYTADFSNLPQLAAPVDAADIIVIDALHPPAKQIIELFATDKTIILTHGISSELETEIKTRIYPNVKKADDYQEIKF
ncbi:MAG: MBL fold metallo-hydrolase [Candidatus Cloacimonetes bacterium]|nr:MBL fold metallo-hydrolase [Candidatus Cloacimonadota bacterium]